MTLRVQALASGSSGNAVLVTGAGTSILLDAGTALRRLVAALGASGIVPADLDGIVLTHEHTDHVRSAYAISRRWGVPLIANAATLSCVYAGQAETPHVELATGSRWSAGKLHVETFPVPHDAAEPVGVSVLCEGHKATYATDVGSVKAHLRRALRGSDLVILELNHDVNRLKAGPYPAVLKRRILSDTGHLSNETAVALLVEHVLEHGPCTLWLAHLSKVNNLPKLALSYALETLSRQTRCKFTLDVLMRDSPSAVWSADSRPLQLNLF